jgi:hypothetical protein
MANIISMEELIASIYTRLDSIDTRDEMVFRDWIWDAIKEIGVGSLDVVTECLPVENLRICKPCYFGSVLEMNLLDATNGTVYFQFTGTGAKESEALNYTLVSETDDAFHLSSAGSACVVTSAEVSFYRLPIDENENPLVREDDKLAIICYVEYQFWKRERNRKRGKARSEMPMSEIDFYNRQWVIELGKVKGRKKMVSPLHAETIMRKWMTLIPDFRDKKRHKMHGRGNRHINRRTY